MKRYNTTLDALTVEFMKSLTRDGILSKGIRKAAKIIQGKV